MTAHSAEARIGADPDTNAACVAASVRLKADVVARDEFEGGLRQVLNFGHTIGHAIEAAAEYEIGHGRAVAFGMIAEARIGERLGVTEVGTTDRLMAALMSLTDGTSLDVDPSEALRFLKADKKVRAGRARYVLLRRIGEVAHDDGWAHDVDDATARVAVTEVLSGW